MIDDPNSRQVGGNHYKVAIEHWDFVLANDVPYMTAQVLRYVCRADKKNGTEDLQKAAHYLDKMVECHNQNALPEISTGEFVRAQKLPSMIGLIVVLMMAYDNTGDLELLQAAQRLLQEYISPTAGEPSTAVPAVGAGLPYG